MAAGLTGLRDLDICGCEQLAEDAVVALSALRRPDAAQRRQLPAGGHQQARAGRVMLATALTRHLIGVEGDMVEQHRPLRALLVTPGSSSYPQPRRVTRLPLTRHGPHA